MRTSEPNSVTAEYAFVVTKPLQLMFAVAIIRQLNVADCSCVIITNSFRGAEGVANRLRSVDWDISAIGVWFCPDRSKAEQIATKLGARKIFVDGDVGARRFFILLKTQIRVKRPELWVYEEGLGTYRTDLYKRAKRTIFNFVGIGSRFGGAYLTKGLYVLQPHKYQKVFPKSRKSVRAIKSSPCDTISLSFDAWCSIFGYMPLIADGREICTLYLSSWEIDPVIMKKLQQMPGKRYFKPHPHFTTENSVLGVEMVDGSVPAELLLMNLSNIYKEILVFHHGSSTAEYFLHPKVFFQRV